jgi:thiol:disulfide interchange protein DsbD
LLFDLSTAEKKSIEISSPSISLFQNSNIEDSSEIPIEKSDAKQGYWSILLATILAGFLATFTPCVFPMIPLTVSFFLKKSSTESKIKSKLNALFYGLSIVFIYVLISIPFHLFESLSPGIFNEISTNVYLNLFFFVAFILFACSFLGAFEINMPSNLSTKSDNASNSGGIIGIFFMALTLIIVSFSCTGPALGFVLGSVLSADGGAMILTTAMLGFGIGLAFPFVFFAIFPSLISNLPKSGGWLNTVKVVFGFIELALAFKFLSNADLVLQLHLLEREVFIAIWITIFLALALYLFGKIKLPHDDDSNRISVPRLLLGMFSLSFVLYMIPGLWGAPLNIISAFPPPQHYSESPFGVGFAKISSANISTQNTPLPKGAKLLPPHNILAFTDYELGLAYAKKVNKPIMLDFTGHACVNCRKMEQNVWVKSEVLSILKNELVLISLYVDDKRKLPESEVIPSKLQPGKNLRYIGEKWSEFQTIHFKANAQPFYVLVDNDGKKIIEPIAYTPDAKVYFEWLSNGIEKFNRQ